MPFLQRPIITHITPALSRALFDHLNEWTAKLIANSLLKINGHATETCSPWQTELPFRGTTRMLLHQVMHEEAPSPRKLNNAIPRDLETICLKCLEKEPGKRYDTCMALAEDLKAWLDHKPIRARAVGRMGRLARWCKRKPAVAALSATVVLVLLAGTAISTYFAIDASRKSRIAESLTKAANFERMETIKQKMKAEEAAEEARLARDAESEQKRHAIKLATEAEGARQLAEKARQGEKDQREVAEKNQDLARKSLKQVEQLLYLADIGRAQRDWDRGNIHNLGKRLQKHARPSTNQRAPNTSKGFEWKYWNNLYANGGEMIYLNRSRPVLDLSVSPDGKLLGAAVYNGTNLIWSTKTGKPLHTLKGSKTPRVISFTVDGRRFISQGKDGSLWISDINSGKPLFTVDDYGDAINQIRVSPKGEKAVSLDRKGRFFLWNTETGKIEQLLNNSTDSGLIGGNRVANIFRRAPQNAWAFPMKHRRF